MDEIHHHETTFRNKMTGMKSEIDTRDILRIPQSTGSQTQAQMISKTHADSNSGPLEKQFIINFDRRCTILLSEEERNALYSSLGDYRATHQINPFLDKLSQILNSPIKMELIDDVRHFVEDRHIDRFDRDMPFGDLSSKVVRILNSTPSYNTRQRSTATTPRLLSPISFRDIDQQSSKGSGESRRIELTKGEERQQLGFSLWGTSDGRKGVFIKNVLPNSLADSAGLKPGDRLLDINDTPLESYTLSQVANLIEQSNSLRIHILRNKDNRNATPKNVTRRDGRVTRDRQGIPPRHTPGNVRRRSNPRIEISPPSAYITMAGDDYAIVNKGHPRQGIADDRSYGTSTPKQQAGTMSRISDKTTKIIPVRSTGRDQSNSSDAITFSKYETLANFPLRTKTVIDLNGKAVSKEPDIIRIEEVGNETRGERSPPTPRGSSTLPKVVPSPLFIEHQKSQSLQSLPTYQASTLHTSPTMGRNTRVIPIIRSYVPPSDGFDPRNRTPTHIYENRVIQPQLNLIPPNYQQYQRQSPTMQYNDHYIPNEPQHYIDRHQFIDERQLLSTSPLPPIFPMVIPHYQAMPRRINANYSYLEAEYPHPGMWKSMVPYGSPNKKLMQRRMKYLSVPDLSSWNRRKINYYDRGSSGPSDLEAKSEIYGYDHPIHGGWRSDHDIEYGRTHRYSDVPYRRRGYDYFDGDRSRFYGDGFRSMRDRRPRDYWDETENSDFETLSTAFDSNTERRNRKFKDVEPYKPFRSNRFLGSNHDSFFDTTPSSRSKSSTYQSHASKEVLFKKDASNQEKIPTFFDDVRSPHLNENETPKKPRRSRYDKAENETIRNQVSPKYISGNKNFDSYDNEFKISKEATPIKPLNKLPKAQPRSKSPSISSISSNFSVTLTNDKPVLRPLSIPKDEFDKSSELKQKYLKDEETEESDGSGQIINLLGYSKLISPGASLRSKSSKTSSKNTVYQNVNFNREVRSSPKHIEDRLKSPLTITYGSDSQSSLASMRTSKSGQYDFIDASGEFNRNQPKTDKSTFSNKSLTSQSSSQLNSAREKIFGKDWANKTVEVKTTPNVASKNETIKKVDDGWINRVDKSLEQGTNKLFEPKIEKDNPTKWSWEGNKNANEETRWPKNVLNEVNMKIGDGDEKSCTIDSADSGISTDINVINSPLKSPTTDPPDIYQKSTTNTGYKIYKLENQSYQTTKFEEKTKSNQNILFPVVENKETSNSDDLWQHDTGTKWRPLARQRTFSERQRNLKTLESDEVLSKTIKIKLDKTCPFLGLSISGGIESRACPDIIIESITSGSAADVEGSLKPGMKLTTIDGQSLVGVRHSEAVKIIKSSFLDKTQRWMEVEAT